jgi:predicted LPLAT superfamily acyltransferase
VIAHGGLAGAIVESALAIAVVALFVVVWVRERRSKRRSPARLRDDGSDQ